MLFTLDNSTVKYREQRKGERERDGGSVSCGSYRLLASFVFVRFRSLLPSSSSSLDLPYLPKQMDYQAELNEIKVDYTAG